MVSLAWLAIILRLWTKARIVKSVLWDDWIMLVATLFFTVYCGSVIDISRRVTSTHEFVSYGDLLISVNLLTVAEVFYVLSIMALKIALSVFFLRLTVVPWQRRVVLVALAVSSSFSVLMFFFVVFQCGVYDNATVFLLRRIANQCASNDFNLGMTYTHAIITTSTDWTFLILPFCILKESLMKKNEKRTIILILMFASIGGIASIIRFKFIHGLAIPRAEFFLNARDIAIWSCLEPGIGIIAGSVVTLRPLIRRLVFLFKNSSYSNSRFHHRHSPPLQNGSPCNVRLEQPQKYECGQALSHYDASEQGTHAIEEKKIEVAELVVRPSIAKKRSLSGLPLHLFGSIKSRSSSKRTRSMKSSVSKLSQFSIVPSIPDMPSFIWRETTDETETDSMKESERDDDKYSERSDLGMGTKTTWYAYDGGSRDPGIAPSPTFEEEEHWLEEQLNLRQLSPTYNGYERRFSQGTGLYSSISSIPSPRFTPSSAHAQNVPWHQRCASSASACTGVPEIPAAPSSPLFPEGNEWFRTFEVGKSRPGSYISEPGSARIPIGLQIPSALSPPEPRSPVELDMPPALPPAPHRSPTGTSHITPLNASRQSQPYIWHQRQGSENSVMQARIESVPQDPASHYQGRTSEESIRWPSTPQSALQEEALRINQERFPPRTTSRIFPPRGSSRVPLPQDNGVRPQPYFAASEIVPPISPRRIWQQKPLPRPPPVERKPLPKGILKKGESPHGILLPPLPSTPIESYRTNNEGRDKEKEKEKNSSTIGLPLDMFSSSSHKSSSSKSSL
ncbi:hypothetical protein FKW77_008574 [Venturia effusa]|uniref:Rhodopsin domain-containing protein n=1 Tax=Venturia effusa TaxID=50376 RepID=A0A517LEB3_9PEZI|nr:hypothetical protein FKW77_008574 [Venturia effusa]